MPPRRKSNRVTQTHTRRRSLAKKYPLERNLRHRLPALKKKDPLKTKASHRLPALKKKTCPLKMMRAMDFLVGFVMNRRSSLAIRCLLTGRLIPILLEQNLRVMNQHHQIRGNSMALTLQIFRPNEWTNLMKKRTNLMKKRINPPMTTLDASDL
jgi:hypothetical protein